jgi:hypothetical protein
LNRWDKVANKVLAAIVCRQFYIVILWLWDKYHEMSDQFKGKVVILHCPMQCYAIPLCSCYLGEKY